MNELKQLFKYESILTKDNFINNYKWEEEEFNNKFGENTLFIINCEFMPRNENDIINIHYDLNYYGSNEFNEIINKNNLKFDWVDSVNLKVFNYHSLNQ